MVNDCIRVGLKFEEENSATPSMKRLSLLCYSQLKKYEVYSAYRQFFRLMLTDVAILTNL